MPDTTSPGPDRPHPVAQSWRMSGSLWKTNCVLQSVAAKSVVQYKDTGSPTYAIKSLSTRLKLCANHSDPVILSGHNIEAEMKETGPIY